MVRDIYIFDGGGGGNEPGGCGLILGILFWGLILYCLWCFCPGFHDSKMPPPSANYPSEPLDFEQEREQAAPSRRAGLTSGWMNSTEREKSWEPWATGSQAATPSFGARRFPWWGEPGNRGRAP
jgi:hypothetical protein